MYVSVHHALRFVCAGCRSDQVLAERCRPLPPPRLSNNTVRFQGEQSQQWTLVLRTRCISHGPRPIRALLYCDLRVQEVGRQHTRHPRARRHMGQIQPCVSRQNAHRFRRGARHGCTLVLASAERDGSERRLPWTRITESRYDAVQQTSSSVGQTRTNLLPAYRYDTSRPAEHASRSASIRFRPQFALHRCQPDGCGRFVHLYEHTCALDLLPRTNGESTIWPFFQSRHSCSYIAHGRHGRCRSVVRERGLYPASREWKGHVVWSTMGE
jgi:hypothetical protein